MIVIQQKNNYSFLTHINKLWQFTKNRQNNYKLTIQNLEEQNLILKSQLQEIQSKINIKTNLEKTYPKLQTLNTEYISINQNGAFIIATSNSENISVNDLVIDKNKFLIGRIINFNKSMKLVQIQMIIDNKSFIPIKTQKTSAYGILSSNLVCKNGLSLENVSGNVENGDIVMTSGEENLTPQGILVGKIDKQGEINCIKHFAKLKNIDHLVIIKTKSYQELNKLLTE